jgi:hypothetical protein
MKQSALALAHYSADELEADLFRRLAELGEKICLSTSALEAARAKARQIAQMRLPIGTKIGITTSRERQFPNRTRYGEALNCLVDLLRASREPIANQLGEEIFDLVPATGTERKLGAHATDTIYFLDTLKKDVKGSIREVARVNKRQVTLRLWDYLCLATTQPARFEGQTFVSVDERVGTSKDVPSNRALYVPAVSVRKGTIVIQKYAIERIERLSVPRFHHLVGSLL